MSADRRQIGLHWNANGQTSLSGPLLKLYQDLDRVFVSWAKKIGAEEHQFPNFIETRELAKLDYFKSFPHLVTFASALKNDDTNLKSFIEGGMLEEDGSVKLTEMQPVRQVLTPAACYHFYIQFQGQTFSKTQYFTTRCTCHRRENYYEPLRRQWNFSMREIVVIGSETDVKACLEKHHEMISGFAEKLGLKTRWQEATDPFFNPNENPKFIWQKIDPIKRELIYGEDLAISSLNFHRNFFGNTFQIKAQEGEASSACIAFGLERWIFAILDQFGDDPRAWPKLEGHPL